MRPTIASALALYLFSLPAAAQVTEPSLRLKEFIRVDAAKVILTHVRVIDGTGAPAVEDQNVVIERGKIAAIAKGAEPPAAAVRTRCCWKIILPIP